MLALTYDGGEIRLREVPRPTAGPGEALIRVLVAGICRTDIEIARGYMNFRGVLGHEFVGVVEECEDRGWLGTRVVGEINLACGSCSYCQARLTRHCPDRTVLGILGKDGAFAEYLTLPIQNLHEVPEGMANETAVFVEPVAAGMEILAQVDPALLSRRRVAVLGDGKLGILAARVLGLLSPPPLALDLVGKHPEKLALLENRPGPPARPPEFQPRGLSLDSFKKYIQHPEWKYDVVVEATGRPEGFELALSAVQPRGTIVQKSTVAGKLEVDLSRVVVDELTVVGSRCGPFPAAISALAGGLTVNDLVSARYPLPEALEAMRKAQEPSTLKVLIDVSR